MYLVISKCVTAVILSDFSGHYLRNRSTLDIGVLGYIGYNTHGPQQKILRLGSPNRDPIKRNAP